MKKNVRKVFAASVLIILIAIVGIVFGPYIPLRNQLADRYPHAGITKFEYVRNGNTYYGRILDASGTVCYVPCETNNDWIRLGDEAIKAGEKDKEIAQFVAAYHLCLPGQKKECLKAMGHEVFCGNTYSGQELARLKENLAIGLLRF